MPPRKQAPKPLPKSKQDQLPEEQQNVEDLGHVEGEGKGDEKLPEMEVKESPEKDVAESPWSPVESMSDDEMVVEAANIGSGYQLRQVWLRIRVNGELTGQVVVVDQAQFNSVKQTFSRR